LSLFDQISKHTPLSPCIHSAFCSIPSDFAGPKFYPRFEIIGLSA
jgi:hypothetical protein